MEVHESFEKENVRNTGQQLLQAESPGISLVKEVSFLTHGTNVLKGSPYLKSLYCLTYSRIMKWTIFTFYLFYCMFFRKPLSSFEHEYKLSLRELMAALIHHLCYFLESFHLLLFFYSYLDSSWDFARDAGANASCTITSLMCWPFLY